MTARAGKPALDTADFEALYCGRARCRKTLYNGVTADAVTPHGAEKLSIEVARDGIVGRGVLLDIAEPQDLNSRFCQRAGLGYRWLVKGVVPDRVVHRKARTALGPGFAAQGFESREPSAAAVWQRPSDQEFVVAWVQPTRSPDAFGWYGSRFIIEFRRGAQPRVGVLGPGFRFCQLLDDEGRERVRAVQNAVIRRLPPAPAQALRMLDDRARDRYLAQGRQVTAAYKPDHDIWFRYRDERDLDAWFRLLPVLLPGVLGAVRLRLG